MKELIFLWNLMTLVAFGVIAVDIRVDPKMIQSQPSYIYCDVGTVTSGVTFFKDDQIQGNCFAPGVACSSNQYTMTQNTTGVLLEIASVDASREEGEWYCQHDADRSTKVSLNHYKIPGVLLSINWTEPSGPVDTFYAVMILSCTNTVPEYNFTYEDSESNTGTVPPEAVSINPISTFNQTNCDNFYEITLTASDNFEDFKNKQRVKFTFIFYTSQVTTPFSVNFIEVCVCDVACTYVGGVLFGLGIGSYVIYTILILVLRKKITVLQIFFVVTMIFAGAAIIGGGTCTGVTVDKKKSCEGQICDTGLGLSAASLVAGIVVLVIKIFIQGMVMDSAGVSKRSLLGNFLHFPREKGEGNLPSGAKTNTEMKNQNDHKKDDKKDDKKHDKKDDKEKKDEKNVESEDPTGRPLPPRTTQKTSDFASPKPKMKPKEGNGEELKPLRDAPRGGLPSPRVNHNDNDSASSASNVTPHVA